jgi:hypothetical protein
MESPATPSVASLFALILDGLLGAIAARVNDYPFNAVTVMYLWKRVNRVKNRFLALAANIQAGRIPREGTAKPRAGKRSGGGVGADGVNWRKWLPMSRFAWLCWMMPSLANRFGAAQFAGGLRALLEKPEMKALLAATPKAGRTLAQLCFMLGIDAALLRPIGAAASPAAAAAEETAPREPSAGTSAIVGAPPPPARALGVVHRPPEPGIDFFVPA